MRTFLTLLSEHPKSIMILLSIVILFLCTNSLRQSIHNKYLTHEVSSEREKFTTWTDSLGREHAQMKEQTVYLTQLNGQLRSKIDSDAHTLGIKPTTIIKYVQAQTSTSGSFKARVDTAGDFSFVDTHLTVHGHVDSSVTENYTYTDNATITESSQPKKFLGLKMGVFGHNDFLDISFDNPNTHITGLTNISLKEYVRPKHWGVGPTVGVTYNNGIHPYIGFGVTYNLIRL